MEDAMHVWGYVGNFCTFPHFCCESKNTLKHSLHFKKYKTLQSWNLNNYVQNHSFLNLRTNPKLKMNYMLT